MNNLKKTKNRNQDAFEKYLKEEFTPALEWAHSEEGRAFIAERIPSLNAMMEYEEAVLAAVYQVNVNGIPMYVGQSLRTIKRLYVHAHHLAEEPIKYFGLRPEEIVTIEMKLLTPPIFNSEARLCAEASAVVSVKPVLQPYYTVPGMRIDTCLPRGLAREIAAAQAGVARKQ